MQNFEFSIEDYVPVGKQYKAGDKYRIKQGTPVDQRDYVFGTLSEGEIVTIFQDATINNEDHSIKIIHSITRSPDQYLLIRARDIELVPVKLQCSCPALNFTWNGIGCQCGGT